MSNGAVKESFFREREGGKSGEILKEKIIGDIKKMAEGLMEGGVKTAYENLIGKIERGELNPEKDKPIIDKTLEDIEKGMKEPWTRK